MESLKICHFDNSESLIFPFGELLTISKLFQKNGYFESELKKITPRYYSNPSLGFPPRATPRYLERLKLKSLVSRCTSVRQLHEYPYLNRCIVQCNLSVIFLVNSYLRGGAKDLTGWVRTTF